jgi:hypothetical protein
MHEKNRPAERLRKARRSMQSGLGVGLKIRRDEEPRQPESPWSHREIADDRGVHGQDRARGLLNDRGRRAPELKPVPAGTSMRPITIMPAPLS